MVPSGTRSSSEAAVCGKLLRLWNRSGREERLSAARGIVVVRSASAMGGVDAVVQNCKPARSEGGSYSGGDEG